MYTFHVFLITVFFFYLCMSLKKSLNLTWDVPKSLLFKVNSVGNPENAIFSGRSAIAFMPDAAIMLFNFIFLILKSWTN